MYTIFTKDIHIIKKHTFIYNEIHILIKPSNDFVTASINVCIRAGNTISVLSVCPIISL